MPIDNKNSSDVSDVRVDAASSAPTLSPMVLPIRGEKRIIPSPVQPGDMAGVFQEQWKKSGQESPNQKGYAPTGRTALVERKDFYIKAAMSPYIDYVYVRLPHRGVGMDRKPDASIPAVYRFLINPNQVSVSRTTLDAQVMTRAGWQMGVWGEDSLQITLSGKTAGQYWSFGVTDRYQEFSQSYRNLIMLQQVFENNGYFFEGEEAGEGAMAADFTRRRIKMHQDVELIVGNFAWHGMFESLTVTDSAETPWTTNFSLSFVAWKERFRAGSPYQNLLTNNIQRGHSYESWIPAAPKNLKGIPSNIRNLQSLLAPTQVQPPPGTPQPLVSAAEFAAEQQPSLDFCTDPAAVDYSPAPFRSYFLSAPGLR